MFHPIAEDNRSSDVQPKTTASGNVSGGNQVSVDVVVEDHHHANNTAR